MNERFLVTGAGGCVGSWVVRKLLDEGTPVVAFDVSADRRRMQLLCSEDELSTVPLVRGNIADELAFGRALDEFGITHVIHLAALQVPFCRADPRQGATVNVLGTVNVFESIRQRQDRIMGLAYASSAAVFGPPSNYVNGRITDDSPLAPGINIYGVYKQANEGTALVYAHDFGLGSVGLRPFVVYGPGRDQGLTSGTTTAMLAALTGQPYEIGYCGYTVFHYAADAALAFILAARSCSDTAQRLNIGGPRASVADFITAIEAVAPEASGLITCSDSTLGVADDIDASGFDRLVGGVAYTPLSDGVKESMAAFRILLDQGMLGAP